MKLVKSSKLHDQSLPELKKLAEELSSQVATLRLQRAAKQAKNTHVSLLSDSLARVKTIIREKELSA